VASGNLENAYLVKPAWSPDGKWIAFLNEGGTMGDIYLIRTDGTDLTRLTNSGDISRDGNLVWSPDGQQISFSAVRGGKVEIYVMDVATALQEPGGSIQQPLTDSAAGIQNLVASWSPDGSQIAFSSTRDGNTEIYLMNLDGSHVVRLTNNPTSDKEPSWSPDGQWIVFSSNRNRNFDIYVMKVADALQEAASANVWQLTNAAGDDVGPVWRPTP
jgi:TolB protein